jgi:hypothetical protein
MNMKRKNQGLTILAGVLVALILVLGMMNLPLDVTNTDSPGFTHQSIPVVETFKKSRSVFEHIIHTYLHVD